jgi:hypothetical protein
MFKLKNAKMALVVAIGLLASTGQQAHADFMTSFAGSGTSATSVPIAAQADFSLSGTTLTITLTNTSATATTDPGSTLTGLYFNLGSTLTPLGAAINAADGSFLVGGPADKFGATQVGQGWAYGNSGVVPPGGDGLDPANTGIISTGYGSFPTNSGNFAAGGVMLDGVAWGIIPSANGNTGLNGGANNAPVINHSVVFTLTAPAGLQPTDITGVEFAYGTADAEGGFKGQHIAEVPVPPSVILLGLGGLGALGFRRRFGKSR